MVVFMIVRLNNQEEPIAGGQRKIRRIENRVIRLG